MIVKVLTRLKNGPQIIDEGATFEGTEKTLPGFILYELERNRGTVEVLPEARPIKKRAVKRPNAKSTAKTETEIGKSASLREKLNNPEK